MFFMPKVIEVLSQGNLFKNMCSIVMRIIALLVGIVGFFMWCALWMSIKDLQGFQVVGLLLHQCVYVVFIYMVVHTLIIHAEKIMALHEADFVVIPIISRVFKLMGDLSVIMFVYWGAFIFLIGSSVGAQFGGGLMSAAGGGETSLAALMFSLVIFAVCVMVGLLSLLFHYWLSELTVVLADMAINLKKMRVRMETGIATAATACSSLPQAQEHVTVEPPKCPQCKSEISETTIFCRECGYKIKPDSP
ncbi:MAG TPA: zinc ribbon domain-containing protein [bacterium]|nr:zinc ribbon domain-containing protein [bacterium]